MAYFLLQVKHQFSAARALRDYDGKCQNIHGHNFTVQVDIRTEDDAKGYAVDFYDVKMYLAEIFAALDHQHLNEVAPFDSLNPTTENIGKWAAQQLQTYLAEQACQLISVTVAESDDFSATYFL